MKLFKFFGVSELAARLRRLGSVRIATLLSLAVFVASAALIVCDVATRASPPVLAGAPRVSSESLRTEPNRPFAKSDATAPDEDSPPESRTSLRPTQPITPTRPAGSQSATAEANSKLIQKSVGIASRPTVRLKPTFVSISDIGINEPLRPLSIGSSHQLLVPADAHDVGWWRTNNVNSPTVMVGHVDSRTGPAVFYRLHELTPGDGVFVAFDDGSYVEYVVRKTARVSKNNFPTKDVYELGNGELRLITCGGSFNRRSGHYEDNVIVFASPIFTTYKTVY